MLTSISLLNFQCHKKLTLDLDHPVVSIVGPSRQGKSSVLRALRWLTFNRPAGNAFVHHGAKFAKVALEADGRKIVRSKGSGSNLYHVNGKQLAAFGAGVPAEVSRLLNLSELNFANQHSSPYWLLSSSAEVSRELNAVVNLDLIDRVIARVAGFVRKAKGEEEYARTHLKVAREAHNRLAWVREAKGELGKVKQLYEGIRENAQKRSRLTEILSGVKIAREQARNASNAVLGGEKALSRWTEARKTLDRAEKLRNLLAQVRERGEERAGAEMESGKLTKELAKVKTCPVCQKPMQLNRKEKS